MFFIAATLKHPNILSRTDYISPPNIIKQLSAGLNSQLSDSFWLRANQDFDYCDQPKNKTECSGKSWLFHMLDLVTDLDSNFKEAFFYGALALTVLISDYDGASKIFDKGTAKFPKSWTLLYAAGYHALFEEKNSVKASKLYFEAAKHGAPTWVNAMAGRLAAEGGAKEYAAKILEEMIATSQDPKLIERLKQKLDAAQK